MLKVSIFIIAIVMSAIACADRSVFYGAPQVGVGRIKISQNFGFENDEDTSGSTETGLSFGGRFAGSFIIEISYIESDGHSLFGAGDSFDLTQKQALIGYSFPLGSDFRFTPKIGTTDWRVEGREGAFLNPGAEEESDNKGNDLIFAIEIEKELVDFLALGINSSWANTEFGDSLSTRFLVKFQF